MRATLLVIAGLLAARPLPSGDEEDPKTLVAAANQKLADQPSYGWNTKLEAEDSGPFRGGGGVALGQRDKEGYLRVSMPLFDGNVEFVTKAGKSEDIQKAIKKDAWNEYVIIAQGNPLQHFINGVQTVDVIDDTPSKRRMSGILALQLHAGEPMTVQFKDIRIKSLRSAAVLAAGNLSVAPGFQLEQIYAVPREKQGSWVALCVDPKGRLIAADQNGTLYRLTLAPLGRSAGVKVESLAVQLSGAHGLLHAFDSLYVMVNERGQRGLYRLRDSKGNDQFDEVPTARPSWAASPTSTEKTWKSSKTCSIPAA